MAASQPGTWDAVAGVWTGNMAAGSDIVLPKPLGPMSYSAYAVVSMVPSKNNHDVCFVFKSYLRLWLTVLATGYNFRVL